MESEVLISSPKKKSNATEDNQSSYSSAIELSRARMPIAGLVKASSRSISEPAIQALTHCSRPKSGLFGQTTRGINVENTRR